MSVVQRKIVEHLQNTYPTTFSLGGSPEVLPVDVSDELRSMFVPSGRTPGNIQLAVGTDEALKLAIDRHEFPESELVLLRTMLRRDPMSLDDATFWLKAERPWMGELMDLWTKSGLGSFHLTAIGHAIGHASVRRHLPAFGDLSIWIN
jgi:hypothetical protein